YLPLCALVGSDDRYSFNTDRHLRLHYGWQYRKNIKFYRGKFCQNHGTDLLKRFLEVHKNGSDHNVYLPAGRLSAGLYDLPVPRGGSGAADFGGDDPYMD